MQTFQETSEETKTVHFFLQYRNTLGMDGVELHFSSHELSHTPLVFESRTIFLS